MTAKPPAPTEPPKPSGPTATELKDDGNVLFKNGDFTGAVEAYSRAIELEPGQHLCYSNRSAAYLKLGNSAAEALADADKCVELMPDFVKGYSRQAAALQELDRWDDAVKACEIGMAACSGPDAASLKGTLTEVQNRHFVHRIKGCWNGKVTEALGGYDQEMEFMDGSKVRVQVLGRSIIGHYKIDATVEPHSLDIQVSMQELPPGMPPTPPVPYIVKLDDKGLHLCCPYMKMERPENFEGEGYCLMTKGAMEAEVGESIEKLSREEKLILCAQELISILPSRRLDMEDVDPDSSEEMARDKIMAQVKFETSVFKVQQKFGEEMMKDVLESTKLGPDSPGVPKGLAGSPELAELAAKLRSCGISLDEAPPPPPKREVAEDTDGKATTPAGKKKSSPKPSARGSGVPTAVVISLTVAAAAVAAGAFLFLRQKKR